MLYQRSWVKGIKSHQPLGDGGLESHKENPSLPSTWGRGLPLPLLLHWITHPGRKFSFFICFRSLGVVFGSSWKVFWGLAASWGGSLGLFLESWGGLWATLGVFGSLWGGLGSPLGRPGASFGRLWGVLGVPWGGLWTLLGPRSEKVSKRLTSVARFGRHFDTFLDPSGV